MTNRSLMEKLNTLWERLLTLTLVCAVACLVVLVSTERAGALYIITGSGDAAIVLDGDAAQKSKTVKDFSSKMVYVGSNSDGFQLTLSDGTQVTIHYNGEIIRESSKKETVSYLLYRLGITPSPLEMVLVDVSGENAVELTIGSDLTYYERVAEQVHYSTIRKESGELPIGTETVAQAGQDGIRTAVYEVAYSNGEFVSRQLVEEEATTVVDEVILVGVADPAELALQGGLRGDAIVDVARNGSGGGVLTLASGAQLEFTEAKTMTATAYTAGYDGANYTTATGTMVEVGTVAVDKRVIPLGTRMFIVTDDGAYIYGLSVASDTGVRGEKVDLYFDTYNECIQFGRRSATVYILAD